MRIQFESLDCFSTISGQDGVLVLHGSSYYNPNVSFNASFFRFILTQVGYNQLQPTEAPTINQNREASPEKPSKQDSQSDRGSLERNYEDEEQSEKSSDDEGKGKSDSEKEDSEKDDDQASKHSSSKNSSATASRKSSSSSHEDNQKEDEKTDENKDVDITDEVTDNLSYEEKVKMAFAGDLDFIYPEKIKIVRIFTSSTFTGTLSICVAS